MGLLSDGTLEQNSEALEVLLGDVIGHWDRCILPDEGLELEIGSTSLSRICLIAENLFNDEALPRQPGPFKRAAAVSVLLRMFGEFAWKPVQGGEHLSATEEIAWRARFALATVPVTLSLIKASLDGEVVLLRKPWVPSTMHVQVEILNLLRWLEKPLAGERAVDRSRLQRTVMAFAMIIEQSYYLVGATIECDVMHRARNCVSAIHKDDSLWRDLTVFHTVPRIARQPPLAEID